MTVTIPTEALWFALGWLASWAALFGLAVVMHRRKAAASG